MKEKKENAMVTFEKAPLSKRRSGTWRARRTGEAVIRMLQRPLKEPLEVCEWRSAAENEFFKRAKKLGWEVTKRGFPDFICRRGEEFMLVEVKPSKKYRLQGDQERFNEDMEKRGVDSRRWSPDEDWLE
jgi:hypothetical protein